MKVRLVAYRPATTSDTVDTTYELDLKEAPNISLNFQFSDIKNPESRKANYSQTFKLPFTDANNTFFENWFNVNLTTLVFSTRKKFNAVLYVGTVPQFDGFLQLKAVYQKSQSYEVTLVSNTANLFSVLGSKKLVDVLQNDDGTFTTYFNHTFDYNNIVKSWDGSATDFYSVNADGSQGQSLQDATAGVQKIMYPISATQGNFFFNEGSNEYLAMSDPASQGEDAYSYLARIAQLRPAIQIKALFQLILSRAGFSYTSNFIDGNYFGKIFMTLGNKLPKPILPMVGDATSLPGGSLLTRHTGGFQHYISVGGDACSEGSAGAGPFIFKCDTIINDEQNVWDNTNMIFSKLSPLMSQLNVSFRVRRSNIKECGKDCPEPGGCSLEINYHLVEWTGTADGDILWTGQKCVGCATGTPSFDIGTPQLLEIPISEDILPTGSKARIHIDPPLFRRVNTDFGAPQSYTYLQGFFMNDDDGNPFYGQISCNWAPYDLTQYGGVVSVPDCVDSDIGQKEFLKDIIERFNLVVLTDPSNPTNILIEPYDDYLSQSTIKDWTKKLDLSKEIVVKDTTPLQKKIINLTDLEDVDVQNKSIKEEAPQLNVYGKYYNDKTVNDFATGELKNNPIFSPYLNQQIFRTPDPADGTDLQNMAIQYEYSYKQGEYGVEIELQETKPKLFYYSGTPTTTVNGSEVNTSYYLHQVNPTTGNITAHQFTTYPLCSVWDINAPGTTYTLTGDNKSLHWSFAPPLAPDLLVFQYDITSASLEDNSLFFLYWQNYLNGIYHIDARIMEAYFDLNETDIFKFKFNDEIFVKDSYWRIINIQNYQVGSKASTKVILLKVMDSLVLGESVDYVPVGFFFYYIVFCPSDNPIGCGTPFPQSLLADPASCEAAGGEVWYGYVDASNPGLFACIGNPGGSPSVVYQSVLNPTSVLAMSQTKSLMYGKLGSLKMPLLRGGNTNKYSQKILSYLSDDMVIKYTTKLKNVPNINGETHRIVLTGHTEGNTRGYAYTEGGSRVGNKIMVPPNTNMMIQVAGISTVIGGSSSTYTVGDTESFSYHTAFKSIGGEITQVGNAGGTINWQIKDTSTTSTLYISQTNGQILFGLDDSQTDTKKHWALTVDITVQVIPYLTRPYKENWALYQNADGIAFENNNLMIWN